MKKRDKSSIIAVDIYRPSQCQYKNSNLQPVKKLRYSKKNTTISYIANKDIITVLIEISSSLPKEHVHNVIIDKVYEELQFDPAVEYVVKPIKTKINGDKDKYQTIIIDKGTLKEKLAPIAKKSKVIDYVIAAPLLYKSLYQEKQINSSGCDLFLYFGDYDSFVTFYYKGEYLYSKSIKYSLKDIYDRFCKLANEVPMSEEKFRDFLADDGARKGTSAHRELLIRVLNECFLSINDILIYTKRAYDIDSVRNAYVALSWDSQNTLEPYVKNYLNMNAIALSTLIEKSIKFNRDVDLICPLMVLNAQALEGGLVELPNLTPFPKPKPITQRPAGKMIGLFFTVLLLFMLPIIYDLVIGSTLQANNVLLAKEEAKVTAEANKYKQAITQKREELKALEKTYTKTEKIYQSKVGEVTEVYNKKFHYQFRSEQLSDITKLLKEYDIHSRNISISDSLYAIELESKDEKQITQFIKNLVQKFDNKIANVDIKDIRLYPKEELYKGVLKIEFSGDTQ